MLKGALLGGLVERGEPVHALIPNPSAEATLVVMAPWHPDDRC